MNIYQRINAVMKQVKYVQKDKAVSGGGQNYKAVTHDQAVSVARQALVDNGVIIYPNQLTGEFLVMRDVNATPQPVKMGLYTGTYEINFVGIDEGDKITVTVQAHANDNGDKAPGKALTYATKSAILKVLTLEAGEDDESREEVREKTKTITPEQQQALGKYCFVSDENGNPQWSPIGMKLAQAYRINSLADLLAATYDEALSRCEKLAAKVEK